MSQQELEKAKKELKELETSLKMFSNASDKSNDDDNVSGIGTQPDYIGEYTKAIQDKKKLIANLEKGVAPGAAMGGKSRRRRHKNKKTMKKKSRKHRK